MGKHRHHKRHYDNNSSSNSSSSSSYSRHRHHKRSSTKKVDGYDRAIKDTKWFCYAGMFIGGLLMLVSMAILIYFNGFYKDNYHKASATVIASPFCVDPKECSMTVEYDVNGKKYTKSLTYDTSENGNTQYVVGQTITIYVDNNNPADVKTTGQHLDVRTLNIVFSILLVIGLLKMLFFYYFRHNPFVCGFYGLSWFLGRR